MVFGIGYLYRGYSSIGRFMTRNKRNSRRQPATMANAAPTAQMPSKNDWKRYSIGFLWYLGLVLSATVVFWYSPELTNAAIPPWLGVKKSVDQLTSMAKYLPAAFVGIMVALFAALGFVVCFPGFKGLFLKGLPAGMKSLVRLGHNAGGAVTLCGGGAAAMLLGDGLRVGASYGTDEVLWLFLTGLMGKALTTMTEIQMEELCIEEYLEARAANSGAASQ